MNLPYQNQTAMPIHVSEEELSEGVRQAMRRVYLWMTLGLLVTGTVSYLIVSTPLIYLVANPIIFFGAMIAELVFVIVLSARVMRMAPMTAVAVFLAYAALNGITMSLVFIIYTSSSIAITFFVTACLFGAMSIVGYTTTVDLTRLGGFLLMALIGLIIGSIANIFFNNSVLYWIITFAGIAIFIGLTAYNTQRIKRMTLSALQQGDTLMEQRIGIIGALSLYLDFVNLFLMLLRLSGRRK